MKNLFIALFLLSITGCDLLSDSHSKLSTSLEIENKKVESVSDIEATFGILNNTGKTVSFGFPSSCQTGFMILKDEEVLIDSRQVFGCLTVVSSLEIKNGERKEFEIDIRLEPEFTPGRYRLAAFLLEGYTEPVFTAFTIE